MPKRAFIILSLFIFSQAVAQNSDSTGTNRKPTLFFRDSLNFMHKIDVIAPDFYSKSLPFFCDKELKVQKMTKIPVKIRLGSVDYVNKLEGKHL